MASMDAIGMDVSAVVLDVGSHSVRFGYAGESKPQTFLSTDVGVHMGRDVDMAEPPAKKMKTANGAAIPSNQKYVMGNNLRHNFIPDCEVNNPLHNGVVKNWDSMEQIWSFCLSTQGAQEINSTEHPLLISESPWNTANNRKKSVEIAFETFQVPAFWAAKESVLSCFSVGRSTGIVVNCGHQYTSCVPVVDGFCLNEPICKTGLAGSHLNLCLLQRMKELNMEVIPGCLIHKERTETGSMKYKTIHDKNNLTKSFYRHAQLIEMQHLKEECLLIRGDTYIEPSDSDAESVEYILPDGNTITLDAPNRLLIPEQIFSYKNSGNTSIEINGFEFRGLPTMIRTCLDSIDADSRKEVAGSVVLTGGTTAMKGFRQRLAVELEQLPHALKPKIITPPNQGHGHEQEWGVWMGGSILASLGFFQTYWIRPEEYQEEGANVIFRKCP